MSPPADLPAPVDDGACDHLVGMEVPAAGLPATTGGDVAIAQSKTPWTVVYETLLKRFSMVLRGPRIEHVIYPVFPSNSDAPAIVDWLRAHAT